MKTILRLLVVVFALGSGLRAARAGDPGQSPAPSPTPTHPGILPIPDYSAKFWDNAYLTGDWGGVRTDLANKGIQFEVQWTQFVQDVASGGVDRTAEYGSNVDYKLSLDLMKMGVLPGAVIKFRAQSRFGDSVNLDSGTILPVNTNAEFPLTKRFDDNVALTITDLNFTQFLSPHFAVLFGKLDTLDADPNEFASGRGTSQFLNANFIFNASAALRLPYSTLGAGLVWLPILPGEDRGITVTSLVMNTDDSSTTTGFGDFSKGTTWSSEADFKYKLGTLPGGSNIGGIYSFNQKFNQLNTRLIFQPGEGLSITQKSTTWAIFFSTWQYLYVNDPVGQRPVQMEATAGHEGIGCFARLGFADKDTNPLNFAISGGLGGRGLIPTRHNDTYGLGYYYNDQQKLRLVSRLGVGDSAQGFEAFYNLAITPACRLTFDIQVVDSVLPKVDTATILGVRAGLTF